MGKVMAVNAGSSSLKFKIFSFPDEKVIAEGGIERIGEKFSIFKLKSKDLNLKEEMVIKDHLKGANYLLDQLIEKKIIKDLKEIEVVGHRVVHGGEEFKKSVIVNNEVLKKLEDINPLAPLHNPANLMGYEAFSKKLSKINHVLIFDTSFHSTIKPEEFLYPLPYEYYEKYKVRKYGFHGTSHKYVVNEYLKKYPSEDSKIITCHIGNGSSVCAVKNGKSIATSMGFTPLSGVMMGTRSGDVDPAVVTYIMEKKKISAFDVIDEFNKKSGLLGFSEISNDSRDIEAAINKNNPRAILTQKKLVNTIAEKIGSYFVKLGGLDTLILTAGIGKNSALFRKDLIKLLSSSLGIVINSKKNENAKENFNIISCPRSKVRVVVLRTNEELLLAREAYELR